MDRSRRATEAVGVFGPAPARIVRLPVGCNFGQRVVRLLGSTECVLIEDPTIPHFSEHLSTEAPQLVLGRQERLAQRAPLCGHVILWMEPILPACREVASHPCFQDRVDLEDVLSLERSRSDESISLHHRLPEVASEGPLLQGSDAGLLGELEVGQDQAEVPAQREEGLRSLERNRRIMRVGVPGVVRWQGGIVDGDRMIGDQKLHVGRFSGDNFPNALAPDRAVHHADALHLEHEFVLCERRVLSAEPSQPLWRAQLLGVDVTE
ncbi:hypothetical protein D3C77_258440 [compost metagenome]